MNKICNQIAISASTFGRKVIYTVKRIANFIIDNRWMLLTYAISWGLILCSIGTLHGFKATAVPFSIGMGAGTAVGLFCGFLFASVFRFKNSIGGRVSDHLNRVDNTTRALAITVAVAVYIIAATRLPHGMGGLTGFVIGDHLAILAYWGEKMIRPHKTLERELADVQERVRILEERLPAEA